VLFLNGEEKNQPNLRTTTTKKKNVLMVVIRLKTMRENIRLLPFAGQ